MSSKTYPFQTRIVTKRKREKERERERERGKVVLRFPTFTLFPLGRIFKMSRSPKAVTVTHTIHSFLGFYLGAFATTATTLLVSALFEYTRSMNFLRIASSVFSSVVKLNEMSRVSRMRGATESFREHCKWAKDAELPHEVETRIKLSHW